MKIGFSTDINDLNRSGKHRFFYSLANQFRSVNIEITDKKPDFFIYIPGTSRNKKARCNVLRLDGLLLDNNPESRAKNEKIRKAMSQADAVIYQNSFCKTAYDAILGRVKCPTACIMNGANQSDFLPRNPANFFLANCKWRPFKRLDGVIDGFLNAVSRGLKSDLIITGEPNYKVRHLQINYVGPQKFGQLVKLLSEAIASVHLSYLDWCPNSVVEAIVAGCPMIYSKSGGQTEMCRNNGIGIVDADWNFNYCNHSNPPPLNTSEIGSAFLDMHCRQQTISDGRFLIPEISTQYIRFFSNL